MRPGAGWNRQFSRLPPQPLNEGSSSDNGGEAAAQRPAIGPSAPTSRPVRYSASATRSSDVSAEPCAFIMPLVSASTMKLGDIARIDERVGARVVGMAWQAAQFRSNIADSALASEAGAAAAPGRTAKPRIAAAASENHRRRGSRAYRIRRKA